MKSNLKKKLKVFHGLINYGTQAGVLADGLRKEGIDAISVAGIDPSKRQIDIVLLYGGNFFERVLKKTLNLIRRIYWFYKYNTFHFYYGSTLFPRQCDLPFYRIFKKKVIMHYLGNDVQGYKKSVEKYKWTNMIGFMGENDPILYDLKIEKRLAFETKYIDFSIVCVPPLSEFVPNSIVFPLAIDIDNYSYTEHPQNEILVIMHAPTHRGNKGTDFILNAITKLIAEGYNIRLNLVENVTHDQLKEEYKRSDIFIDQIMGGWYGTASIEAMALGRPVICSIRESYFEHINYGDEIPIIHADPDCIYDSIKQLINNNSKLPEIGRACRNFVEKVHDSKKLSKELIGIYKKIWS